MLTFDDALQLAKVLHNARVFRTPSWEVALAVITYGGELGLGPATSLTNISVVQGKLALGAAGIGALIKRSNRYDFHVRALDDQHAVIDFTERRDGRWEAIGTSTFTLDDARRAGLGNSPTWKSYPRNLLLARALSNGARWYCPSVTLGSIYDPEELGVPSTPDADELPVPDPPMAPVNGATTTEPVVTLEGLTRAYGAEAVYEASGGRLPATDEELQAVAERLAATVPTVGVAEAADEATP